MNPTNGLAIHHETVLIKGAPTLRDALRINNQTYVISGTWVRTASLKCGTVEWQEGVTNPQEVILALDDLLRFVALILRSCRYFSRTLAESRSQRPFSLAALTNLMNFFAVDQPNRRWITA